MQGFLTRWDWRQGSTGEIQRGAAAEGNRNSQDRPEKESGVCTG